MGTVGPASGDGVFNNVNELSSLSSIDAEDLSLLGDITKEALDWDHLVSESFSASSWDDKNGGPRGVAYLKEGTDDRNGCPGDVSSVKKVQNNGVLFDEWRGNNVCTGAGIKIAHNYCDESNASLVKSVLKIAQQRHHLPLCQNSNCAGLFCKRNQAYCMVCELRARGKSSDDSIPELQPKDSVYDDAFKSLRDDACMKVIVVAVMNALGIEESENDLRSSIQSLVQQGQVPKTKHFLFDIRGRSKEANKKLSFAVWASKLLIDLLTIAELNGDVDQLVNMFLCDEPLAAMNDVQVVRILAGIAYSVQFGTDILSHTMRQFPVVVSNGDYVYKTSRYNGKAPLISLLFGSNLTGVVLRGGVCTGFCPEVVGDAQSLSSMYPKLSEFFTAACDGSIELLKDYLELMFPKMIPKIDEALLAVYNEETKAVQWFPLYLLAYIAHLQQTVLMEKQPFVTSLVGTSGGKVVVVDVAKPTDLIQEPNPSHFELRKSRTFETSFLKILVTLFGANPLSIVLRSHELVVGEGLYSFNFSWEGKRADLVEDITSSISRDPEVLQNSRVAFALNQLMRVISSSNKDGIATAKASACLVSGALVSNIPFPALNQT